MTLKRAFDVVFSFLVLVCGFPVFLFLGLLVKTTSQGSIFYGSSRIGKDGKSIICYKFRTMHENAEEHLEKMLSTSPLLQEEWKQTYKLKNDTRITCIGSWMRKTSLDELPQFWNVFLGDLSVVGPRPVSEEESKLYLQKKGPKLFSIRPGLTGIWQTSGRNNLSYDERIDLDERYIDTHSFVFDLWLILKTIPLMIFPKGAF